MRHIYHIKLVHAISRGQFIKHVYVVAPSFDAALAILQADVSEAVLQSVQWLTGNALCLVTEESTK